MEERCLNIPQRRRSAGSVSNSNQFIGRLFAEKPKRTDDRSALLDNSLELKKMMLLDYRTYGDWCATVAL
jgi:hypothetical protein